MRKLALAAAAAVLLLSLPMSAPASASAVGVGCGLTAVADPLGPPSQFTGELSGGPAIGSGTLICSAQVGYFCHSDPDAARLTAPGPAATGARAVTIRVPGLPVYVCTAFQVGSPTYYWNAVSDRWGTWEFDSCQLATSTGVAIVAVPPVVS